MRCDRFHRRLRRRWARELGAVEASNVYRGTYASARRARAPAPAFNPWCGPRRRRGQHRTPTRRTSERVGHVLDRLVVPQPRLRRHPLFAARIQIDVLHTPPACAGVHLPDGLSATNFQPILSCTPGLMFVTTMTEHRGARTSTTCRPSGPSHVGDEGRPRFQAQPRPWRSRTDALVQWPRRTAYLFAAQRRGTGSCSLGTAGGDAVRGRDRFRWPPMILRGHGADRVPPGARNNLRAGSARFALPTETPIWRFNTVGQSPASRATRRGRSRRGMSRRRRSRSWTTSFRSTRKTATCHVAVTSPSPDLPTP
jgi:hypothetical protein